MDEIQKLKQEVQELKQMIQSLKAGTTIPLEIENAFRDRFRLPFKIANAPRAAITAPSGGMTADSEARTAINSIITALEQLGLVGEN